MARANRTKTAIPLARDPASPIGRVTRAEYILNGWGLPHRGMRVIESYSLVYLLAGSGVYEIAPGRRYPVQAGDLLFVFPDVPHWYGSWDGGRWDELFVIFDGPIFDLWARVGVLDPATPILHLEPVAYWRSRFEAALGIGDVRPAVPLLATSRLQAVLAAAFAHGATPDTEAPRPAWVAEACQMLADPAVATAPMRDIAARLGTTHEGFRKRFTRAMGIAPAQYRARCVIQQAQVLIARGALSNREIAAQLGFCDEYYFSRRFKQIAGVSPRMYRERLGELQSSALADP